MMNTIHHRAARTLDLSVLEELLLLVGLLNLHHSFPQSIAQSQASGKLGALVQPWRRVLTLNDRGLGGVSGGLDEISSKSRCDAQIG